MKTLSAEERGRVFGELLNRACERSDLTRRQLADQLDLSLATVTTYLMGGVDPLRTRVILQQRLARLNGLSMGDLLSLYCSGDWHQLRPSDPELQRPVVRPPRRSAHKAWRSYGMRGQKTEASRGRASGSNRTTAAAAG